MKTIIFDSQSFCFDDWLSAFQKSFGSANFRLLSADSTFNDEDVGVLLLWHPQRRDWRQLTNLQQVVFLGAGLDKHQDIKVPPCAVIYKLGDSGMQACMCEYAHYAVLKHQRQFHTYLAQQRSHVWQPKPYITKRDFTIGVLGLGALGLAVATYLSSQGYRVVACSRSHKDLPNTIPQCPLGSHLNAFLTITDVLIVLLPLNQDTYHLINHQNLSFLKPSSAIVNLSRGAVIDAQALKKALTENKVHWAMLDVFEQEPLDSNDDVWTFDNLYITPHISAPTNPEQCMAELKSILNCQP